MKERLDVLLVKQDLAPTRQKAQALIMEGKVYVNGQKEEKSGSQFDAAESLIEVRGDALPYVSRGGLKLEKALTVFDIDLNGKICMDVGASTGGFTDCMLQNGASKVYAIDVGRGQLDWKLRQDERVICMEKTNIRYVLPADIPDPIDFCSIDVSFISLSKVLPPVRALLKPGADVAALIKPQFEAGRDKVGKKGVVRDAAIHLVVVESVMAFAAEDGYSVRDLTYSPIKGPEGNIEYLIHLKNSVEDLSVDLSVPDPASVVREAHEELDK